MTEDTSPIGAAEITTSRQQCVVETASLRVPDGVDEFYLSDLRQLVDISALIPGDAVVRPRHDGIDITYTTTVDTVRAPEVDEPAAEAVRVPSDDAMDDLRARLAAVEPRPTRPPAIVPAATGESVPVEEVRRVVELIRQATGESIRAIAEMVDIPPTSLISLMAPSWKHSTARRSTYDKLGRLLDELAAEGSSDRAKAVS
ncbi:hypothetical protein [Nocardia vaccinii]|uniref:hypothetical protein n=1 Tax=Nocardia vaccinii TaxID=1822 RepID=UPI00082D6A9B|nr:hypothetical protein [Nocardia vaccinii]